MKVALDILDSLDRAKAPESSDVPPAATSGSASAPHPAQQFAATPPPPSRGQPASLLAIIKRATPYLWLKVDAARLTRREQRARLCELIQWLAVREGAEVTLRALRPYPAKGRMVEGRVDLRVLPSSRSRGIDVEIAFEPTEALVQKLWATDVAGGHPLLVCGFSSSLEDALKRLEQVSSHKRWHWLQVVCIPVGH